MKSLVLLLLSLTLIACNKKYQDIDPEFQSDFDSFIAEANQRGRMVYNTDQITIKRGVVIDGTDGVCHHNLKNGFSKVEIVVRSDYKYDHDLKRKSLIFHELGHCLLYKRHQSGFGSDGFPISLMNAEIPGFFAIKEKWNEYLDELMSYNP